MKKKHGRILSGALATALTVANIGALNPITALAATPGDVISFANGDYTSATVDSKYVDGIEVIAGDGTGAGAETETETKKYAGTGLPDGTTIFGTGLTVDKGYELIWNDGKKNLTPGTDTYEDVTSAEGKATLTAKKVGKKIGLNYIEDGGTQGKVRPTKKVFGTQLASAIDAPTKVGYTFDGWDVTGDDKPEFGPNATVVEQNKAIEDQFAVDTDKTDVDNSYNHDVTLTAIYTEKTYTITYNGNGMDSGSVPPAVTGKYSKIMSGGGTLETATIPKKKGYELVSNNEWCLTNDGTGEAFKAGNATYENVIAKAGDKTAITLYLNWDDVKYDLTLDDGTHNTPAAAATTFNISNSKWSDPASNTTTLKDKIKYTGSAVLPTVVEGDVIDKNNEIAIAKTGYNFLGWDTASEAKTVVYEAGATVTVDQNKPDDITLYPVWEAKPAEEPTYTVTYANGDASATGTAPKNITDVKVGDTITLPENPYTNTGKTFTGWTISGKLYEAGSTVTITKDMATTSSSSITVTATWVSNTFTLELYDGSNLISKGTVAYNSFGDSLGDITLESGKSFLGWDTDKNAVNPKYSAATKKGALFTEPGATITLYAIGSEKTVELTYDDESNHKVTVAANSTVTLDKAKELDNKNFVGWTVGQSYADKAAADEAKATIYTEYKVGEDNLAFYAVYDAKTVTVKFDGNGGTGSMADTTATYDSSTNNYKITTPVNAFSRPGYSFKGWNVGSVPATDASVKPETNGKIEIGATVPGNVNSITVYAVWVHNTYRLSFNKNSDTATSNIGNKVIQSETDANKTLEATIGSGSIITNSDETKEFAGWSFDPDATGAEFLDTTKVSEILTAAAAEDGATITLYAVWEDTDAVKAEKAEAEAEDAKNAKEEAESERDSAIDAKTQAESERNAANNAKTTAESERDAANAAKTAAEQEAANAKAALAAVPKAQNNAVAASGETVTTKADGTATITNAAVPANGTYEVPSTVTVNGATYNVTKIEANAFKGDKKIKQITIPATIEEIGKTAFQKASNLKKITIKGKDVVIRKNAFKGINKKAKIVAKDKDTRANIKAKGGAPKSVKIKKK